MSRKIFRATLWISALLLQGISGPARAMETGISIEGRLAGPEARPVQGATVELAPLGGSLRPPEVSSETVAVGAAGTFRLMAPEPGLWRIVARAPGFVPATLDLAPLTEASQLPVLRMVPARRLAVRVLDLEGRPIGRVVLHPRIELARGGKSWIPAPPSAVTGADGSAVLELPSQGRFRVNVTAPGFAPEEVGIESPSASPLAVRLRRARGVFGRVVGPGGEPVRGARVRLVVWPAAPAGTLPEARPPVDLVTDAAGSFRARRLPVGTIGLEVLADGLLPASAGPFEIRPGSGPADLGSLVLEAAAQLEGRVTDPQGAPIAGAEVRLTQRSGGPQAATGADGEFRLEGLRAGETVGLRVSRRGYAPAEIPEVTVPEPVAAVLVPAVRLAGRAVDELGEGVAGATLFLTLDGMENGAGPTAATGVSDDAGRFTLEDVKPGAFRLTAFATGHTPGVLAEIDTTSGAELTDLEVVLGHGAVIEGTVTTPSGDTAAGARVALVDNGVPGLLAGLGLPQAVADAEGRYRLEGLAEGKRSVRAELPGLLPATGEVEVSSGPHRLDLRLRGGAGVSGLAVTTAGEPVAGAVVRLLPLGEAGPEPLSAASDADGSFRFPRVADGRYRLQAERQGYAGPPREIEVRGLPVEGLTVRLDRGGTLTGRIAGLASGELARVEVRASSPSGGQDQVESAGPDGRYRFDELGAGPWTVVARVKETSRAARGVVSLAPGQETAFLDFTFGSGLTLTGRVGRDGHPVGQAWVTLRSGDGTGTGLTSEDGVFRIEGLAPGRYTLHVVHPPSGLQHSESLDLDRDLDVSLEL